MFMNKQIMGVIAFAVVVGVGIYGVQSGYINTKSPSVENNEVIYTDAGYDPSPITIKVGDTVKFVNNSSVDFWPASAMHPTHTVYPGSNITKCNTPEANAIFDACKSLAPGVSWSFLFTEKGKWNYHDHLNVSEYGSVVGE